MRLYVEQTLPTGAGLIESHKRYSTFTTFLPGTSCYPRAAWKYGKRIRPEVAHTVVSAAATFGRFVNRTDTGATRRSE